MANLLGKPQQKTQPQPEISNILKKIGQLSERTRLLEERMKQTRSKIQVLDETFSAKINDLRDATNNFQNQLISLRKELSETKELLRRVVKELGSTAKLSDVKVLEKYINMIDITRLITKEDVEKIVEEKLKKKKS